MLHAGEMRERITIQVPSATRTAGGAARLGWKDAATVWAKVSSLSGREVLQSMQANVIVTHRIYMRFRPDVNPESRIVWRGQTLEVVVALPKNKRSELEVLCKEVE